MSRPIEIASRTGKLFGAAALFLAGELCRPAWRAPLALDGRLLVEQAEHDAVSPLCRFKCEPLLESEHLGVEDVRHDEPEQHLAARPCRASDEVAGALSAPYESLADQRVERAADGAAAAPEVLLEFLLGGDGVTDAEAALPDEAADLDGELGVFGHSPVLGQRMGPFLACLASWRFIVRV